MLRASATAAHGIKAGLLACALLLLAAPAAWAGAWLPPQDLSAPGRSATNPVVAMADDGATTALWEKDNTATVGFHGEIVTRSPGSGLHLALGSGPRGHRPADGDDRRRSGDRGLEAARQPARQLPDRGRDEAARRHRLRQARRPVAEMPTGVIPNGLQIAINGAGDLAVVWTRPDPESAVDKNAIIVEASVRPAGGSFSEPEQVSLPIEPPIEEPGEPPVFLHLNSSEPSVAIDAAGDVTVVWRYNDGTDQVIEASERPAGGTFATPEVISGAGKDSFEPQVAVSGGGEANAVWEEVEGEESAIEAASRPDGGVFGAAGRTLRRRPERGRPRDRDDPRRPGHGRLDAGRKRRNAASHLEPSRGRELLGPGRDDPRARIGRARSIPIWR